MEQDRHTVLASLIVVGTGAFWGVYWLPVRVLEGWGMAGAWGTVAITVAAVLVLLPLAIVKGTNLAQANRVALASIALGGAAFALYSIGFIYGRVAIIILLWFLSPVWSTLIARYLMGWKTPPLRMVAIVLGLLGLMVMLGADGGVPLPRGAGEWMSLSGGILWSFSTTGIRVKSDVPTITATLVFALGAAVTALVLAPMLEPIPTIPDQHSLKVVGVSLLTGGIWWGLTLIALMWATVRLEPARVSILLMVEVFVGAVTAALFADETLHAIEIAGGVLVLFAGVLEVMPTRRAGQSRSVSWSTD